MTARLDARAAEIFMQAVDLPAPERAAFVHGACADNSSLHAEVKSLLAADADRTRISPPRPDPAAALVGSRIGSYRLVRLLGSGGMGTVYEAEQENPRRPVALKLIRAGVLARDTLRRFEYESQLLARLRHPGIAQIFEAGTHAPPGAAPVPFFAMEFVENAQTLTDYCAARRLSTRDRLELFAPICDAVHHGHTKGVIHRDLKPGNILVDSTGQSKIIDFGIARATDSDIAAATINTAVGQLIGTLHYMSPEQCAGDSEAIDTRSDVYALGVVLYELLTSRLPYDLGTRSIIDAPRIIREQAPTRLSSIDRALRGDIETIVLKALEKDRERRYASAAEFAADIRRFLRNEPISARPAGRLYHARMFARRNRGLVAGITVAFLALATGLAAALRQTARARSALDRAQAQAYAANIAAAEGALRADDGGTALARLDAAPRALRGWEWFYLRARSDASARTLTFADTTHAEVAAAADGSSLLLAQSGSSISLRRVEPEQTLWTREGLRGFLHPLSRDGGMIALHDTLELILCEAASGREVARVPAFAPDAGPMCAHFDPSGDRIATGDAGGRVTVWNWKTATIAFRSTLVGWIWDVQFSPDGANLAYPSGNGTVLIDTGTWTPRAELPCPPDRRAEDARAVRFSPDGSLLAASRGPVIQLWEVRSGTLRATSRAHTQCVLDLAFSPDGERLASVGADRTVRLWNVSSGAPPETLVGHSNMVASVGFIAGGRRLVSACDDRSVKLWDVPPRSPVRIIPVASGPPASLAFTPPADRLLYSAGDSAVMLDLATNQPVWRHECGTPAPAFFYPAALSPDGRWIAASDHRFALSLLDALTGTPAWTTIPDAHSAIIHALAFTPDAGRVASASSDGSIALWDVASGRLEQRHQAPGPVERLGLDPAGRLAAHTHSGGALVVWGLAQAATVPSFVRAPGGALALSFSPDGALLAVGTAEGTTDVWNTRSWRRVAKLAGMQPDVWALAFSPDGSRLAAGSKDRAIHIWDTTHWNDLVVLRGHGGTVWSLAWSPDGTQLASGSIDGTIRIWVAPAQ